MSAPALRSPTDRQFPGVPDPVVQAYFLKKMVLASRDAVQRNTRGVLDLLLRLEPELAVSVLRELDTQAAAGLGQLLLHLLWEDPRPEVQAPALKLLGMQPEREQFLPELLRLRKHLRSPRAVSALVSVLGCVGRELPFRLFKPFLAHPDARVRANTLEALLDRLHPRLTEVFAVMVNDPSPRVRALAALALWRLGRPVLTSLLAESEDPAARLALAHAAGRVGQDANLADALFAIAGDEALTPELRRAAASALGTVASRRDISRLIGVAYKAGVLDVRRGLVASAASLDAEGTAAYLTQVLERLGATTRHRQLASTLSLIGVLHVQPQPSVLEPYLAHPDSRVAANATETLGAHAADDSVSRSLSRSLSHPASRVSANAAVALWRHGCVEAFSRLRVLAGDAAAGARASAAWAFGRLGGLLAQDAVRPLLEDPDENVRHWAFEALR